MLMPSMMVIVTVVATGDDCGDTHDDDYDRAMTEMTVDRGDSGDTCGESDDNCER